MHPLTTPLFPYVYAQSLGSLMFKAIIVLTTTEVYPYIISQQATLLGFFYVTIYL